MSRRTPGPWARAPAVRRRRRPSSRSQTSTERHGVTTIGASIAARYSATRACRTPSGTAAPSATRPSSWLIQPTGGRVTGGHVAPGLGGLGKTVQQRRRIGEFRYAPSVFPGVDEARARPLPAWRRRRRRPCARRYRGRPAAAATDIAETRAHRRRRQVRRRRRGRRRCRTRTGRATRQARVRR